MQGPVTPQDFSPAPHSSLSPKPPTRKSCFAKEASFFPFVGRFISICLECSYPTYLNPSVNFKVKKPKDNNNNKTFAQITQNKYYSQCQGRTTITKKKTRGCFLLEDSGGLSQVCPKVHGKQKDDKVPLYLTALCHPQLPTHRKWGSNKRLQKGTLCSCYTLKDNGYGLKP